MPVTLSSRSQMFQALRAAHDVTIGAYVLGSGNMLRALTAAAGRGVDVTVYLAAQGPAEMNAIAAARLRAAGAHVVVEPAGGAWLHAKMAVVDGVAFLDDCNWTSGAAGDTILRDGDRNDVAAVGEALAGASGVAATSALATHKSEALASEAAVVETARSGDAVAVESESFDRYNAVYGALKRLAQRGGHARLLVSRRDLKANPHEGDALQRLGAVGVDVRVTGSANAKFAVSSDEAWVGSANATAAFAQPDQIDWGARTSDTRIVDHLRADFEARWQAARPA